MTPNRAEVQAAAERVRSVTKGDGTFWDRYSRIYENSKASLVGDEAAIAEAYLAQDPSYDDLTAKLAAAEAQLAEERARVAAIISSLQRKLQLGGSPPPGDETMLAEWIIDSARDQLSAFSDRAPKHKPDELGIYFATDTRTGAREAVDVWDMGTLSVIRNEEICPVSDFDKFTGPLVDPLAALRIGGAA